MNKIASSLIMFILTSCFIFHHGLADELDFDFPEISGVRATVVGNLFSVTDLPKGKTLRVRAKNRKKFKMKYFKVNHDADEIAFILCGIGGDSKAKIAKSIAKRLMDRGIESIVVPSIFTEAFSKSFSRTGYPGYLPWDAKDMIKALHQARLMVEDKRQKRFKAVHLLGYSLGALTAAHMSQQVSLMGEPRYYQSVTLINSPVDLLHGVRYLDRGAEQRREIPPKRFAGILGRLLRGLTAATNFEESKEKFSISLRRTENINDKEMRYFVAKALRSSLDNVVLSSQEVDSLHILEQRVIEKYGHIEDPAQFRQLMKHLAKKVSFFEYIETFLVEYLKTKKEMKDLNIHKLNSISSLYPLESFFEQENHIRMIHNTDDFLLRPHRDVRYLEKLFGSRLTIFPRGGHLGNYWHKESLDIYIKNIERNPASSDLGSGTYRRDFAHSF